MAHDDEDEETPKETEAAKAAASPVAALIQRKFLEQRKLSLWGPVEDASARDITERLLYLEAAAPGEPITFYINTPGGSITAGMAIYDTMNFLSCEVNTYCIGLSASMATILIAAGTKGKRHALPNCRVMIHQPSGGATGQTSDISIAAKEILRWRDTLNHVLAKHSGKTPEELMRDSDRDFYMTAEQAKAYGLVDHVVMPKAGRA